MYNFKKLNQPFDERLKLIDINRDFEYNSRNFEIIYKNSRDTTIISNEKKIKFIENLNTENLVCIVPNCLEDFTKEGQQQNNCVGFYYHDNIARGKDYIYFIREKMNLNKSYVTCRYNTANKKTVEYKFKNNRRVTDEEIENFLKIIDNKITELLNNS